MRETITSYFYHNIGKNFKKGFFVEIGAFDGKSQNSTVVLEKKGWQGVCIEPVRSNFELLQKNRKCKKINGAVWNKSGTIDIADVGIPGWTGIKETHQHQHKEKYNTETIIIPVKCYRFHELDLPNQIDYLQIDTEGCELDILNDIDKTKYNIDYICIEDNLSLNGDTTYHDFMTKYGYEWIYTYEHDKLYKKL
jgi:FkbM family methyltransferase